MNILTFMYGDYQYEYELVRLQRKTLSLTVHPDMRIVLKSPVQATMERIEGFLRRKWLWLEKQLRFFKQYQRAVYRKEYLSGESFMYRGRQYLLKVEEGSQDRVSLMRGYLLLTTTNEISNGIYTRRLLHHWYKQRAITVFKLRLQAVLKQFNYTFSPELEVRKMPKRWGSFVSKKKIILNPDLVKASTDCIDYVVIHELCHMAVPDHNRKFYALLEQKLPDWKEKRSKLNLMIG
jgi:hypothetical protein